MADEYNKHKATSQQDARLPATQRRNIDDEHEVDVKPADTAKDAGVGRGDDEPQVRQGG